MAAAGSAHNRVFAVAVAPGGPVLEAQSQCEMLAQLEERQMSDPVVAQATIVHGLPLYALAVRPSAE